MPRASLAGGITLVGRDDLLAEGNETLAVEINSVTGGTENGTQQVTVTLVDTTSDPFTIAGNTLTVAGTPGNDTITVLFSTLPVFSVNINGQSQNFNVGTTGVVNFDALGGNDTLVLRQTTPRPTPPHSRRPAQRSAA